MKRFAWLGLWCVVSTAFAGNFAPLDIYKNDAQTRLAATPDQMLWTVDVAGCTGSMLTPRYLLTAEHCNSLTKPGKTFTSGACLTLGCKDDIKVVSVAENNDDFDYQILEVTWNRTDSRALQRYAPKVQTRAAEVTLGKDGQATELFTVGFPGDKYDTTAPVKKRVAMHAMGFAKDRKGRFLKYNVGSINGNSGGAVWKADDFTLVSMTNHGPHILKAKGWDQNDPEDSKAWNGGPQMDLVYDESELLQELYPGGVNPKIGKDGKLLPENQP